jgi:hypothetical protein
MARVPSALYKDLLDEQASQIFCARGYQARRSLPAPVEERAIVGIRDASWSVVERTRTT